MKTILTAGLLAAGLLLSSPALAQPTPDPAAGPTETAPADKTSQDRAELRRKLGDPGEKQKLMQRMEDPAVKQRFLELFDDPADKQKLETMFAEHRAKHGAGAPMSDRESDGILKMLENSNSKNKLFQRMEDPTEKQKIMDMIEDPEKKQKLEEMFGHYRLQKSAGIDQPVITPALPAAPPEAPPEPTLQAAEEDPASVAIAENLLPPLQQPEGDVLTMDECLRQTFALHPNLTAALQGAVQAEAQIRVVDAAYVPTLSIIGDKTRQADPRLQQDTTIQLQMAHTLYDGGQRKKKLKAAQADFRAAVRNFQNAWVTQVQLVTAAYIAVLQSEFIEAVQADNLARTDLNFQVSQAFYQGGMKSMIDVSTARIQQAQAQVALATAKNNVVVARVQLAQAMGVPVENVNHRPLDDRGILSATEKRDRDQALAFLDAYHPALTSLTQQALSNFASAEAARRVNAPVLSAYALYGNTGDTFPNRPDWSLQLSLEFDFFTPDASANGDANDAAGHQLLAQRDSQELLLIQQLDSALANMEGARERASYAIQGVRQSLINADLAQRRYKVGLSDITELINARSFVESTRSDLILALSDLKRAETLFLQAMGAVPVPPGIPADSPLLILQIDEPTARDKALKARRGPLEVPENKAVIP